MSDKPASPARGRKKTAPPAQQPPQEEVVVRLPLADLYPFPDHPFQVRDDEEMRETIQSVKEYGVIVPAIVRPREEGGYEIVAGHRRKYACEQAGLDTMPVLIRNLDRDAATIIMVDSNLQRENILPSERAKAYKMKLEAIPRPCARSSRPCAITPAFPATICRSMSRKKWSREFTCSRSRTASSFA